MRLNAAIVALSLAAIAVPLGGQTPGAGTAVLVTSDSALHLQAWKAGATPGSLEATWAAKPRSVDAATWTARRGDAIVPPRDGPLTIADVDGDGQHDLLAIDAFGLTVYGRTPAYYPFERVPDGGAPNMAAADVDGDRAAEVILLRRVFAGTAPSREIEIVKLAGGRMQRLAIQPLPDPGGTALAAGDADNDGRVDIVTGGNGRVTVLSRGSDGTWVVAAEWPSVGSIGPVVVADADRDGRNEILVGGNAGRVTTYKATADGGRQVWAASWQSRFLASEGLTGSGAAGPTVVVQAIAVGDVTGDSKPDVVASVLEVGTLAGKNVRAPRLHVFSFDGHREFTSVWASEPLALSMVSTLAIGDLDGDGANEFVVNGREVFRRDATAGTFRSTSTGCATCTDGVIGSLGALGAPATATRVIPLYWDLPGRQMYERQTASVTMTLLNPFAGAKDVSVTVTSANPRLAVAGGTLRVPGAAAGATIALPPFSLTANEGSDQGSLQLEITAAGGYRQVVPVSVYVAPPLPTYQADVAGRLAHAMAAAKHENRRVLIVWGSNAEKPSQDFILTMMRTPELSRTLLYEYEVVRADYALNAGVADKYAATPGIKDLGIRDLPFLMVLDAQGAIVAVHPTAPFRGSGTGAAAWDGRELNETLAKYKPAYVEAEPLLAAALDRAKRENKTLFLWFNAPW